MGKNLYIFESKKKTPLDVLPYSISIKTGYADCSMGIEVDT
jgi:hypothetical protein